MAENPTGRPTKYTEEMANNICSRLAMGKSLRAVCKEENMPSRTTVFNWFNSEKGFLDQYTRAKDESADSDSDRIASIAETVLDGSVDAQAARVAIDAYKWMAGKKKPKKYGDKIQTEHSGSIDITSKTVAELNAELRDINEG